MKIRFLLLMMCCLMGSLTVKAQVASGQTGPNDNLTWVFDNGTLTISGTGDMGKEGNNFYSSSNTPWNSNMSKITTVIIEDGVTNIGGSAFGMATLLSSVTIPKSVTSIGRYAFYGSGFASITIPEKVGSIEDYAFGDCAALTQITVLNPTPPEATSSTFSGLTVTNITLNVPANSENDYKDDDFWGQFNIKEIEDEDEEITIPDGYHPEDYTWLYNYVDANPTAFGIETTYTDFDDFFDEEASENGVTWYSEPGTPKRIISLLWSPNDEETLQSKLIGTLDVSALDKLVTLICKHNEITGLKLPADIEVLYCWDNKLTELEVGNLTQLTQLSCARNQLTVLDVENLTNLISIDCMGNQISELKVDNLIKLENLFCSENLLKELNVKNLTKLTILNCQRNQLQKLEVTNLVELFELSCFRNEITTLDTKNLTKLTTLYCSRNKLTELTVGSTIVEYFQCHMNQIPFSKIPKFEGISTNDYAPQYIIHSGSVHPNQVVDLKAMVVDGDETIVTYGEKTIARLTVDNPSLTIPADWLGEVVLKMTNAGFPQSEEGGNAFTYTFDVTLASSVYHTINLEVADGIEMYNLTAGNHQVEEGGHLHVQFLTEDRTLTTNDILFLIDGVETEFKELGENNYYSYILNPVAGDHTILVALKEYPVTLPETKGVTFDVGAGTHLVAYSDKFSFTMTLADGIDPAAIHVYANGQEIQPDALRLATLTYTIDKVITPITIVIEGAGEGTTGNADIATGDIQLRITNYELQIENTNSQAVDVAVYAVTGQSVVQLSALRGSKTISLRPGIYLVKAGSEVYKVSVN